MTQDKVWDEKRGAYRKVGAVSVVDASGADVTAEREAAKVETKRKTARKGSAASLLKSFEREAATTSGAVEDRSVPVSAVSTLFAEAFNRRQAAQGKPLADVEEMADVVEDYAVKSLRAEMLACAKMLTAEAKRLTADDVRVLANVSGSSVRLFVPGLTTAPDSPATRASERGDRARASVSVAVTPDPKSAVGVVLRDSKVSPRAMPKPEAAKPEAAK